METYLNQIIQLSSNLLEKIESSDLETFEAYTEQRDELFAKLQELTPTKEQVEKLQPLVRQIQSQDTIIVSRMTQLQQEASDELNKLKVSQRSRSMYESSVGNDDSMFFDLKR
ncbi:flagellar protein FliT [Paenibacillus sp. GSMTC-2017]|uniref:flagellar protein FliT n=1 Tax=Paenibacillus sp. GSMTC-2017 TaxID=2794350 RepID=UPI0018D93509|nr:flagellar protein FliT [Paenibacillus sp. GSMTC-2017]MBH5320627.1 flagellar protein FliT [Paenibacillus sp. GSMTC-2017]